MSKKIPDIKKALEEPTKAILIKLPRETIHGELGSYQDAFIAALPGEKKPTLQAIAIRLMLYGLPGLKEERESLEALRIAQLAHQ